MASHGSVTSGGDGHQSDEGIPNQNAKRRKLDVMVSIDDIGDIVKLQLGYAEFTNLFAELNILSCEVENVQQKIGTRDVKAIAREVLERWRQKNSHGATRQTVLDAMEGCHYRLNKEQLEEIWKLKVPGERSTQLQHGNKNGLCMLPTGNSNEAKRRNSGLDAIPNFPYNMMIELMRKRLTEDNLKSMKNLLRADLDMAFGVDRKTIKEIVTTESFLDCLEEHRLLSPNNLVLLQILLTYVNRNDLTDLVNIYSERIRDAKNPLTLCHVGKEANGMFFTELKIRGDQDYLYGFQIDQCRELLAKRLGIKLENVRFEAVGSGCITIVFQLPKFVRGDLRSAAMKRADWLVDADVEGVHINGEDYISLLKADCDLSLSSTDGASHHSQYDSQKPNPAATSAPSVKQLNSPA